MKIRSDVEVGRRILRLLGLRPQAQLADAVGMQASALSRSLNGERAFNMSELVDIADYLGVSIEELVFEEEPSFVGRAECDDASTAAAVSRCARLVDAMLQLEAVGR